MPLCHHSYAHHIPGAEVAGRGCSGHKLPLLVAMLAPGVHQPSCAQPKAASLLLAHAQARTALGHWHHCSVARQPEQGRSRRGLPLLVTMPAAGGQCCCANKVLVVLVVQNEAVGIKFKCNMNVGRDSQPSSHCSGSGLGQNCAAAPAAENCAPKSREVVLCLSPVVHCKWLGWNY